MSMCARMLDVAQAQTNMDDMRKTKRQLAALIARLKRG